MSETDLSRAITKALTQLGHVVVRVHSGKVCVSTPGGPRSTHWMQLAEAGTPDRVVLSSGGITTWLEVKTPKGRLSPEQVRWHERAKKGGHRVAVVRSVAEALKAVNDSPVRNLSPDSLVSGRKGQQNQEPEAREERQLSPTRANPDLVSLPSPLGQGYRKGEQHVCQVCVKKNR